MEVPGGGRYEGMGTWESEEDIWESLYARMKHYLVEVVCYMVQLGIDNSIPLTVVRELLERVSVEGICLRPSFGHRLART